MIAIIFSLLVVPATLELPSKKMDTKTSSQRSEDSDAKKRGFLKRAEAFLTNDQPELAVSELEKAPSVSPKDKVLAARLAHAHFAGNRILQFHAS